MVLQEQVDEGSTHLSVTAEEAHTCLGPDGSAAVVLRTFGLLSGKWKLPILFRLFGTPVLRFSDFRRELSGISHKMLAQHLRELERDGLVVRLDHGEQPPRVDYRLSPSGQTLAPLLRAMRDTGAELVRQGTLNRGAPRARSASPD